MWKKPREPSQQEDTSVSNVDLIRGMRNLAAESTSDANPDGRVPPDLMVCTSDGQKLPSFRALLAATASSFRAMFSYDMRVRHAASLVSCQEQSQTCALQRDTPPFTRQESCVVSTG
jgi:hypothetical protein